MLDIVALAHTGDADLRPGRSVALTDIADRVELGANRLYVEFYRPRGTRDQLMNTVHSTARTGTVLIVNRSRPGFCRRDREVLDVLAPHLGGAVVVRQRIARLTAPRLG